MYHKYLTKNIGRYYFESKKDQPPSENMSGGDIDIDCIPIFDLTVQLFVKITLKIFSKEQSVNLTITVVTF